MMNRNPANTEIASWMADRLTEESPRFYEDLSCIPTLEARVAVLRSCAERLLHALTVETGANPDAMVFEAILDEVVRLFRERRPDLFQGDALLR